LTFAAGIAVGHLGVPALSAQFRSVKTTSVLTRDLTGWCDGKELTVELNDAGPGSSGKHYHPAHSFRAPTSNIDFCRYFSPRRSPIALQVVLVVAHADGRSAF